MNRETPLRILSQPPFTADTGHTTTAIFNIPVRRLTHHGTAHDHCTIAHNNRPVQMILVPFAVR
jgi:hypothetical protein